MAAWNAAAHTAYTESWQKVVAKGGFVWNLFRDPDGNEAFTTGQSPVQPTQSSCKEWMTTHCGTDYDGVALMMTPETGSERQSVAAFLLLRGPHAFWGKGWMGDDHVFYDPDLGQMDPGVPTGRCKVQSLLPLSLSPSPSLSLPPSAPPPFHSVCGGCHYCQAVDASAGVYEREYSKMKVTLRCDVWTATFSPTAISR